MLPNDGAFLLLMPVHTSQDAERWALLCLQKDAAEGRWSVRRYDSLLKIEGPARAKAGAICSMLDVFGLQLEPVDMGVLAFQRQQTDCYSCGYWVLLLAEEELRAFTGEGVHRVLLNLSDFMGRYNKWLAMLLRFKAHATPLLQSLFAEADKPKPPVGSKPEPLLGIPKAADADYGCPKCRWVGIGCLACNPRKALQFRSKDLCHPAASKDPAAQAAPDSEAAGTQAEPDATQAEPAVGKADAKATKPKAAAKKTKS